MINYVFFGSPEFAAIILESLIKTGFIPAAVVCNPDRPVGRKKIVTLPPTKLVIGNQKIENGIKVLQPEILDSEFRTLISKLKPDVFIVAAYAKIIPKEILEIPRLGTIGVHPSLLPRHRGASPIQSAILEGDEVTGVTLYLLDEKMDHGPIIAGQELKIGNSNSQTLMRELAELGAKLLAEKLPKFIGGEIKLQVQNEEYATYTKKIKTEDAFVNLAALQAAMQGEPHPLGREKAIEIERKVRALNPEPGVWTIWNGEKPFDKAQGKRVKILEAELKEGRLVLKKIQFEGKKPQVL
ncbi:MAG: methionyl-tRNA formyltransferase [Candidatus Jorgensenbacteria bacterium]